MKPFETRLRRPPFKPVPAEWRTEILAAMRVQANPRPAAGLAPAAAASLTLRLRQIFWPSPVAWGGLAAVWIIIFVLNFAMWDGQPALAVKAKSSPAPVMTAELRQQQRLFAELLGAPELRVADRQRTISPKPRSERAEIMPG